ncbi:hypothetical protein RIR_e1839_XM_025312965.1 [Rhizophagus irregularis DAOM 181602=DAOM 197198]|nr:hypothetical protein RIR_e1839_XM_025312965.1 [Rhizophagus irregularis DAOM 181602=DAOM 197198]
MRNIILYQYISSYVADFCMWGPSLWWWVSCLIINVTVPLHEFGHSRYTLMSVDSRHGGLNLSFLQSLLRVLESSNIFLPYILFLD